MTAKLHQEGPNKLTDFDLNMIDLEKFKWIVYWYEEGFYDGGGEAVALGNDGLLYVSALGHCSCFGPTEHFNHTDSMTIEEFNRPKDSIHDYDCRYELKSKVGELLLYIHNEIEW